MGGGGRSITSRICCRTSGTGKSSCLAMSDAAQSFVRQTSAAPTIAEIGTPVRTHWLAAPGARARRNPQRVADRPARLPLNAMDPHPPHCRRPNPRGCIHVRFHAQQQRALRFCPDILGEYRPALVVEDSACAFERGIARWKPGQVKLEMLDSGTYQLHRLLGRRAVRHLDDADAPQRPG